MNQLDWPEKAPQCAVYDSHLLEGLRPFTEEYFGPDHIPLIQKVFDYYRGSLNLASTEMRRLRRYEEHAPLSLSGFDTGFSNRTLGLQFPDPQTAAGAAVRGTLQRVGLCLDTGGEFFRGSFVFPLRNKKGHTVEAYGQRIPGHIRRGTEEQLYWSIGAGEFFNAQALNAHDAVTLCEHPFQAVRMSALGARNVIASVGRWGFNEVQLDSLEACSPRLVTIAFQSSLDGRRAADLAAQAISSVGVNVEVRSAEECMVEARTSCNKNSWRERQITPELLSRASECAKDPRL